MNYRKFLIKWLTVGAAIAIIIIPAITFSAVPNVRSVKPTAKQSAPLSDEQQGIIAVRNAKASVVSIIGSVPAQTPSTSTAPSLQAVPNDHVEGTGFIWDATGLIVSNNHVVEDSSLVYRVVFPDGTEYPTKILSLDKYDDVAILKIDTGNVQAVSLGDSGSLETGQTVFAIGNSLGKYQNSVTKGVVSALGRSISTGTSANPAPRLQNLIQTDAAINPGNSGGPLIDMSGAVVGMSTLIDTEGSGLGFAIPINTIKDVVNQLKAYGKVSKAYMGVQFATIDGQLKAIKNLSVSNGAYLNSVVDGSPAAVAGLKPGDIITEINHKKLNTSNELDSAVSAFAPGTQILVTYLRGDAQNDAALVLGVLP